MKRVFAALLSGITALTLSVSTQALAGGAGAPRPPGRFIVKYEPTKIKDMQALRTYFIQNDFTAELLNGLASLIRLPVNIPVTFKDCGDANAFWDPQTKSITYCYEIIDLYAKAFDRLPKEEKVFYKGLSRNGAVGAVSLFVLMHELGHGLISLYNIPATGREEDAVDQFATVLLISGDEKGSQLADRTSRFALFGAMFFRDIATNPSELTREILADEHALGQQRYYDVMCMVLGSDSEKYAPLITPGVTKVEAEAAKDPTLLADQAKLTGRLQATDKLNLLPYERAFRCEDEYKKYSTAWDKLLDTFVPQR